jgi:hypothetical protein
MREINPMMMIMTMMIFSHLLAAGKVVDLPRPKPFRAPAPPALPPAAQPPTPRMGLLEYEGHYRSPLLIISYSHIHLHRLLTASSPAGMTAT